MSHDAYAVGRRIVEAGMPAGVTPEQAVAEADRLFVSLRVRLGRWIGVDAFDALFERALANQHVAYPLLARWRAEPEPHAPIPLGLTPDAVRDAVERVLDDLTGRLGRFIGDDLAARLMLQDLETTRSDAGGEPQS